MPAASIRAPMEISVTCPAPVWDFDTSTALTFPKSSSATMPRAVFVATGSCDSSTFPFASSVAPPPAMPSGRFSPGTWRCSLSGATPSARPLGRLVVGTWPSPSSGATPFGRPRPAIIDFTVLTSVRNKVRLGLSVLLSRLSVLSASFGQGIILSPEELRQ